MALIWVQAVVDFTSPLAGEWASGEIDEIDTGQQLWHSTVKAHFDAA